MSTRALKRINNDILELERSKENLNSDGIYFYYDESNIYTLLFMLVGPRDTPYENGFYFFELTFKDTYPMEPPIVKYMTQGVLPSINNINKLVRFNPNLYTCGKVCLSMLNTWEGPRWVPTNTVSNILVAIQALVLNSNPLENEPGYENKNDENLINLYNAYNSIIEFANIKITVIDMYLNIPKGFEVFKDIMKGLIISNRSFYENKIEMNIQKIGIGIKLVLKIRYSDMNFILDYNELKIKFNDFYENL